MATEGIGAALPVDVGAADVTCDAVVVGVGVVDATGAADGSAAAVLGPVTADVADAVGSGFATGVGSLHATSVSAAAERIATVRVAALDLDASAPQNTQRVSTVRMCRRQLTQGTNALMRRS